MSEVEQLKKENQELRSRISELEAVRMSYALLFDRDDPRVGDIHQNIRGLMAENRNLRETLDTQLYIDLRT